MAELKLYQLEQQLQTPINFWKAKCYLFTGEESFLKEDLIEKTLRALKIPRDGVEYVDAEAKEGRQGLVSTLNTIGFDGDRKIVIVRNAEFIDAATCKYLYESWDNSDIPDTVLPVFLAEKVDQRRKLWQLVKEEGIFVHFWSMFEDKLIVWVGQRMRAAGLKFERGCDNLLASLCGNNLLKITKEIEKMTLFGQTITQNNIREMVKKNEEAKRYDIDELFCQRQIGKLIVLLCELDEADIEPKDIAMTLARCARHAIQAKSYLKNKQEFAEQLLNAGKQIAALQNRKDWPGISKRNDIMKAAGTLIKSISAQDKMCWTSLIKLGSMGEPEETIVTQETTKEADAAEPKKKGRGGKAKKVVDFTHDEEKEKEKKEIEAQKKQTRDAAYEAKNHNIWAEERAGNIARAFLAADKYSDQELLGILIDTSKLYFSLFMGEGDLIRAKIDTILVKLMTN